MTSFKDLLHQKSLASQGNVWFELRSYQVDIAQRAVSYIVVGRSVIVDLTTGAGKTNVALLTALLLKRTHTQKQKKVLYIVPSRILIGQVVRAATWAHDDITRVAVTQELSIKLQNLIAAISESDIIITTPGIFASLLIRRKVIRDLLLSSLGLVIVDEFDEFLIREPTRYDFRVRFDTSFNALNPFIKDIPLLLMSGTAPSSMETLVNSDTAHSFAMFIQKQFDPITVIVPEDEYSKYIPVANVNIIKSIDPFVISCEQAIAYKIATSIEVFSCENGIRLDISYLLERLKQIASGSIRIIPLVSGNSIPVDVNIKRLVQTLLALRNKYAFLYEDMFADINPIRKEVHIFENCQPTPLTRLVFDLEDNRLSNEYFPHLRGKSDLLLSIVAKHSKDKGLIFTRNTRLSDTLADFLCRNQVSNLTVDGRINSENGRIKRVREYQESDTKVLIISRNTGRRGLDLPMADYAILYSPKEDEYIVWQELSRIRSTLSNTKPSYILFYGGTSEEARVQRLQQDIVKSSHRYKLTG